jgi:hypothetical protein
MVYVGYKWIDGLMHFAGSYPYAEVYELNYSETDVIQAVATLKAERPEFTRLPNRLVEGRTDSLDYWYNLYFYLKDENEIIFAWTRPSTDPGKTKFALVSFLETDGVNLKGKDINKDFGFFKNKKRKAIFENQILKRVQQILSETKK